MVKLHSDPANLNPFESPDAQQNEQDYELNTIEAWEGRAYSRLRRIIAKSGSKFDSETGVSDIFDDIAKIDLKKQPNAATIDAKTTAENMVRNFSNAVEVILGRTMGEGMAELGKSTAHSAKIDKTVLFNTWNPVWEYITQEKRGGLESLAAAEAELAFVKEAEKRAFEEWEKVEERNREFMNKYQDLGKIWGNFGINRREGEINWNRSFRQRVARFTKLSNEMQTRLADKFEGMNARGEDVRDRNEKAVENVADSIDRQFKFASDDTKEDMWQEVTGLIVSAKSGGMKAFKLDTFGIPAKAEQDKITFLEAVKDLDWVKDGVAATDHTKALYEASNSTVEAAKQLDKEMKNPTYSYVDMGDNYEDFSALSEFTGLTPAGEEVQAADLIEDIWDDLAFKTGKNPEVIMAGQKVSDLLDTSSKMHFLLGTLFKDNPANPGHRYLELLDPQTKRKLLRWVKDIDRETGAGIEGYDDADVQVALAELKRPKGIWKQGEECVKLATDFDLTDAKTKFTVFQASVDKFSKNVVSKYALFEKNKKNFPQADRKKLEEEWMKVKEIEAYLVELASEWAQAKKDYDIWSIEEKKLKKERDAAQSNYDTEAKKTPGSNSQKKSQAKLVENHRLALESAQGRYDSHLSAVPTPPEGEKLGEYAEYFRFTGTKDFGFKEKNVAPDTTSLHERVQRELYRGFNKEETEQRFLARMGKYDAYETLKKAPVGARVEVDWKVVSRNELKFPSELFASVPGELFHIAQKNDKGVELVNGDRRIRITHPLVEMSGEKPGKVWKNMTIAERKDDTTAENLQTGIAFNLKLAA